MQRIISIIAGLILIALGVYLVIHYKRPAETPNLPGGATSTPQTLTYTHSNPNFEISYSRDFSVRESYIYQELGPGKDIPGVSFVIPQATALGTNLSSDSYVSVEWKSGTSCSMTAFLDNPATSTTITSRGFTWEVASTTDAAAGSRYEETVFLTGCTAIRYFVHYGNIQNYPQGEVREFDRAALLHVFDSIRDSLVMR